MTKTQRRELDANLTIKAAITLGFPEEHLALPNLALGRAIGTWVNAQWPAWAPDDSRWVAWTANINEDSETITDAAAAYQAILAG